MTRIALLIAVFALAVAGCNSSDTKTFKTSKESPAVDLPPGVKLPDQKAPDGAKPDKTKPN